MHAVVLKYFQEVARLGSVRKASEVLFVASSAINRQILKLEGQLGMELFDRLPGGMKLNAAGARLLKHIQGTLNDFQAMRGELHALKGVHTGHVKVAGVDSLFGDVLPTAIEEFSQLFPAVRYSVSAVPPIDAVSMVVAGQVDVAVTFVTRLPTGSKTAATFSLPIGVVMPPGHPLSAKSSIELADCTGLPFLRSFGQPPVTMSMCPEFVDFWEQLEPELTCNWTPMVKRLVIAGRGISFFSKVAFLAELARGEVAWRPFSLPALRDLKVGIVVPTNRELPRVTADFASRLARKLAQVETAAANV